MRHPRTGSQLIDQELRSAGDVAVANVIKAQDAHLKEVVANGDDAHIQARKDMQGRWKRPVSGMGWYVHEDEEGIRCPSRRPKIGGTAVLCFRTLRVATALPLEPRENA